MPIPLIPASLPSYSQAQGNAALLSFQIRPSLLAECPRPRLRARLRPRHIVLPMHPPCRPCRPPWSMAHGGWRLQAGCDGRATPAATPLTRHQAPGSAHRGSSNRAPHTRNSYRHVETITYQQAEQIYARLDCYGGEDGTSPGKYVLFTGVSIQDSWRQAARLPLLPAERLEI